MAFTPLWAPKNHSNLSDFTSRIETTFGHHLPDYNSLHHWSISHPDSFWSAVWDFCGVVAKEKGERIFVKKEDLRSSLWFPDAKLNYAENLLRKDSRDDAIIFQGEDKARKSVTFKELRESVFSLAHYLTSELTSHNLPPQTRIAGVLPNIPETVISMLGATSIGAIWSSCSPDFGAEGIIDRFKQIEPTILFTTPGYLYNGKYFDLSEKISTLLKNVTSIKEVIVISFPYGDSKKIKLSSSIKISQFENLTTGKTQFSFPQFSFDHPLSILYSSGTTGVPKCIVHRAGGVLLQHLKEHRLHVDLREEERIFYFTTCGWMMWNWLVTALASNATLLLYDGSPFFPNERRMFDFIDEEKISIFGTSAKFISSVEKAEMKPISSHSLASLRCILSTGSPLLPQSFDYIYRDVKKDVQLCSISGGTDIVSCFVLGSPTLPVYRGEIQCKGLGMDVDIFDEHGQPTKDTGELVCKNSFPSMPIYFWSDPDGKKYEDAYFSVYNNVWRHGDWAKFTEHGGIIIYGRSDATLNPGGVRIGTTEIYRAVELFPEILESVAVGQNHKDDTRIILFLKLRAGFSLHDELIQKIKAHIKTSCSPRHVPAKVIAVPDIPRTINGKIVELAIKNTIEGQPVKNINALLNPKALDYYKNLKDLAED